MKSVPVVEQNTQFYQRPVTDTSPETDDQDTPIRPQQPVKNPQSTPIAAAQANNDPDWTIIGLGIAAFIMLVGLIPLWFTVYRAWAG